MNLPARDSLGRLFDASKFKARLDKVGRWINARAGRKPARKSPAPQPSAPPPAMPESSPAAPITETPAAPVASAIAGNDAGGSSTTPPPSFADIERAAKAPLSHDAALAEIEKGNQGTPTAETIIGIIQTALVLIGDDEGILSETEKMILRGPLDRVLKKYKVGDDVMPPEVDLAFALAGLIIVRLKKPKTATFAAKVKAWIVNAMFRRKGEAIRQTVIHENPA